MFHALASLLFLLATHPTEAVQAPAPTNAVEHGASSSANGSDTVSPPTTSSPGAEQEKAIATDDGRRPLSEMASPWWAVAIGALGGLAYIVAAWSGFVGKDETSRERVLKYFQRAPFVLVPMYVATAGCVAMVFQVPEKYLVPIQAFILGCTWPAVVANYLSGRQSGDGAERELERIEKEAKATREQGMKIDKLPANPATIDEKTKEKLAKLEALVAGPAPAEERE